MTPWSTCPPPIGGVRILDHIGSGGSGEVFRGIRTTGGVEQVVAIKRFHAHCTSDDDLQRFAREQQLLARLTHPDIVRSSTAARVTMGGRTS